MQEIKAASGQGWARAAVAVGAVLSVAGNATETVLTTSPVHLAIRIVIATFLPVIVFIAVEVFVRVAWRTMWLDRFGRGVLLLFPALGAAYVSFGHLYSLSRLSGSDEIAASANALAIDGLMIGGTVALLAIRAARLAETLPAEAEQPEARMAAGVVTAVKQAAPVLNALGEGIAKVGKAMPASTTLPLHTDGQVPLPSERPVSAPLAPVSAPPRPRTPRGQVAPELEKAVRMLLDGASVTEAVDASGAKRSTVGRYGTLRTKLMDSREPATMPLPESLVGKVNDSMVALLRDHYNRARAL